MAETWHRLSCKDLGLEQTYYDVSFKEASILFEKYINVRLANGLKHPLDPSYDPDVKVNHG